MDIELANAAPEASPPSPSRNSSREWEDVGYTRFDFEHKVFSVPGACIAATRNGDAVLQVKLGNARASMSIGSVFEEFRIVPGTQDYDLMLLAQKALNHVRYISPGDAIPTEIIDGTASWSIDEKHYENARNRLLLKLATQAAGSKALSGGASNLAELIETPEVAEHIRTGFSKVQQQLGLPDRESVVQLLEDAGREMAYIEALKDHFRWILTMPAQLSKVEDLFIKDRIAQEQIARARALALAPIKEYRGVFVKTDAQFDDIMQAFANLPDVIDDVRQARDRLHAASMIWTEVEAAWQGTDFTVRTRARETVNLLYGFLAQNFLQSSRW